LRADCLLEDNVGVGAPGPGDGGAAKSDGGRKRTVMRAGPDRKSRQLSDSQPKNRILAALPDDDFRRLAPHLDTVPIHVRQVLHSSGEEIQFVYFPNGGVASIATVLLDGSMQAAATVGDEGVLGGEAMLSAGALSFGDTQIRVPDTNAERMSVDVFRRATTEPGVFRDLVGRYLHILIMQLMQNAACRARHDAQQRCAHWLLSTHDRMHRREFSLSHEGLADMLGMQRPTVSAVAAALQRRGLIRYTHGRIAVLDRPGLEEGACECYARIRAQLRRLGRQ
jgi:CRP-like cAMP-binding protein